MRGGSFVLLVILLLPVEVKAETAARGVPRLVVLDAAFDDAISAPLRQRVMERLLGRLDEAGLEVIQPGTVSEALEPLGSPIAQSCRVGQCVGWLLEALDADAGLELSVTAVENSYAVALNLLGPEGDLVSHSQGRCDICTFDELAESVGQVAGELDLRVAHRVRGGYLRVETVPDGASIFVDGVPLGRSSLVIPLPPGQHLVEAREGERGVTRQEVAVEAERTTSVRLELGPSPRRRGRRSRMASMLWTTIGLGLALTVAGAVFVGLDPYCLEESPGGACARSWEEQSALGSGLLGSGLASAFTAGLALILLRFSPN